VETVTDLFGERQERKEKPAFGIGANGEAFGGHAEGAMFREDTGPATDDAKKWAGWGTALKPAFEPVVVARKPLIGTVAENVLTWGVGGLNIDGSRIGTSGGTQKIDPDKGSVSQNAFGTGLNGGTVAELNAGRWPANIILDEYTAGLLDEQQEDSSRFFYVAKASKRDRNEGLDGLETKANGKMMRNGNNTSEQASEGFERFQTQPAQNFHPTVKPTDLMRYLIKLVTPAGGTVLDPFTGSGSTGKAALLDGYQFVGIELTAEYLPIIEGRLKWASNQATEQQKAEEKETKETLF
jgi:site-specific DNA-methyltransferase (adenine-specific)